MYQIRLSLLLLLLILFNIEIKSNHIFGGDLTYVCIDHTENSSLLRFNYVVYQDCESNLVLDLMPLKFWQNGLDTFFMFELDSIIETEENLYSCTGMNEEFCYNKLSYSHTIDINLNVSDVCVYNSSCCRSNSLLNVDLFSNDIGAIHSVCLSNTCLELCNNSAKIENSFIEMLCKDEFFELLQDATDVDNDQLVYEFCVPYESVTTTPPYQSVEFLPLSYNLPDYSMAQPLGQGVLSLNPNTGLLSGTPTQTGSFVVGICVSEYRNGTYLSTTRRDIQLNVVSCEPYVSANIEADEIDTNGTYIINSCNNQAPTFNNLSTQEENITNLIWSFNVGDEIESSTQWSPSIYFEEPGSYNGNLILNPDGECSDTLDFIVNVVADIEADFMAEYDTCISGPVQFYNNSFSEGSQLTSFQWSFGDGTFSDEFAPLKTYEIPSEFEINLQVTDEFNCKDSISGLIDWRPAPAILIVSPETAANCAPLATTFNNLSWPIDSTYSFTWDFGDGSMLSNNMNPNHEYLQEGVFDVTISIESPIGCYVDTVFQNLITVEAPPIANFDYSPDKPTQFDSSIDLMDKSERAVSWRWFFDQRDSTWMQDPTYIFADTGQHTVELIVQDFYGCADTMLQIVDVVPQVTYFLPNAFSPNGDGENDYFSAKGIVDEMLDFEMSIFDRWGGLLFSTTNPNFEWDGNHQLDGKIVSKGVYVYLMNYTTRRGKLFQEQGMISLIR